MANACNYVKTLLFCCMILFWVAVVESNERSTKSNSRILNEISHNQEEALEILNIPKEINVDPRYTYNQNFMALMNSPCRPEKDGFFGATSGDATRVQYGFQMEIHPFSITSEVLNVIEDKIVDSIIMNTFPNICGPSRTRTLPETTTIESKGELNYRTAQKGGHPSGFRFFEFEEVASCVPQVDTVNFCSVFSGVVHLYGRHQNGDEASHNVLSYINEVLNVPVPSDLHSDVASIFGAEEYSTIDGNAKETSSQQLSRFDTLLIIISSLIFLAIVYYLFLQWSERNNNYTQPSTGNPRLTDDDELDEYEDEFDPVYLSPEVY